MMSSPRLRRSDRMIEGCQRAGGTLVMTRWLACACILALAGAPGTAVGQAKDTKPDDELVDRGVLASAVHKLYSGIGRGLVELLDLPLLGPQEAALDGFTTVRMIANRSGMYDEGMVAAAARAWYLAHEQDLEVYGSLMFYEAAGLRLQRHYAIVCLLVGSDPDGWRQFAIDAGMPQDRIEECPLEYERVRDGWERLLAPHAPNASRPASRVRPETRDGNITVAYKEPKKKRHRSIRRLVEGSGLVETVVEDVMSLVALPKDVKVVFKSCAFSKAPFDNKGKPTVGICYEYLAANKKLFQKDDVAMPPEGVAEHPRIFPNMSLEEERTAIFVLGNTLFGVYHELGTALLHDLNLPIISHGADAADSFAAISIIPDEPDDFRDQLVLAAANRWYLTGAQFEESELAYWSGDSVDKQRHFFVLCLLAGSDPDGQFNFVKDFKLQEGALFGCSEDLYQPMVDGWEELLRPHAPSAKANSSGAIGLVYEEVGVDAHAVLRDLVKGSGVVEEGIDKVMGMVALPRDLQVVFMDCKDDGTGDDLTFFDEDVGRAVICYSFLARLEEMGKDAVERQII